MVVVNINNLTVDEITIDDDWVYVISGDNTVLISRVVMSRINVLLSDDTTK